MGHRTYDQYCPVAAALDVVGDRWTLLIMRELLAGDRRFTDLRTALPGIAPNLLSERLRDLQAEGLVEHKELPPPAARTVYSATADGRSVAPVLQSLARFQHLDPGDLLLTGTPVGTALSAPAKPVAFLSSLLPPARKWKIFLGRQRNNPRYLQDGDVIEAVIGTDDGAIDLGAQRTTVRWAR